MIRSYFSNRRTQQRQWDEPPSGASKVEHASDTMQKMAQIQLQEMQIATGNVPDTPKAAPAKKSGFAFFRRSNGKADSSASKGKDADGGKKKIQYKSDSFLANTKRESKKTQQQYDELLDLNLQKALASSMSLKGEVHSDDEMELALAMSRAESSSHRRSRSKSRDTTRDGTPVRGSIRSESPSARGRSSQRSSSRSRSASTDNDGAAGERSSHKRLPPTGPPRSRSTDGAAHERSSHRRTRLPLGGEGSSHRRSHGEGSSHRRSHAPAKAPKISTLDPPSAQEENTDFDASIVRFEFSHDEEEEMALAMSLSLIEFDMNEVKAKVEKPAAAAAKMPIAEEEDATAMTEEEQLSIALSQSMAIAAPEHKSDALLHSGETKTPETEDNYQKMRAASESVARNNPGVDHVETVTLNTAASTQKSVFSEDLPGTTYLTSLNDRTAEKPRRHPRMTKRLSGSHLANHSTVPPSRSGSYQGNRTRSLSPGPGAMADRARSSSKSPDYMRHSSHSRSHARKSPDPMRHSSHSRTPPPKSPDPMRHRSHSRSHAPKSPDPMRDSSHSSTPPPKNTDPIRHSSHSRTPPPKSSLTGDNSMMRHSSRGPRSSPKGDSMMRHSSRGERSRSGGDSLRHSSQRSSPKGDSMMRHSSRGERSRSGGDSLRHSSHGPSSLSPTRASANDSLRHTSHEESSSMRQRDTLLKYGPTVPDLSAGQKPAGDHPHIHHRGHQTSSSQDGAPRRRITKGEAATREEKMLRKAMKASLTDLGVGNADATPNGTEPSRGAKPVGDGNHHKSHHGQVPARRKLTEEEVAAREEREEKMLQKAMRASLKEQDSTPAEAKEHQGPATAAPTSVDKSSTEHHRGSHRGYHPHDKNHQGRRKLTEAEIAAKEEKMLQKALRASTEDSMGAKTCAVSQTQVKKETSLLRRHNNRKKQEEILRKEEKMLQEALKASLS
jgi:hypothetical protein